MQRLQSKVERDSEVLRDLNERLLQVLAATTATADVGGGHDAQCRLSYRSRRRLCP
jgi:hypothetical protein